MEEPGALQSMGLQTDMTEWLHFLSFFLCDYFISQHCSPKIVYDTYLFIKLNFIFMKFWRLHLFIHCSVIKLLFKIISIKNQISLQHYNYFPFYIKEALSGFCLAHLSCQHHHSCPWRPYWHKIRITWTQALPCVDGWPDNPDGCWVTNGQDVLDKDESRTRQGQAGWLKVPSYCSEGPAV